jgi:hypothetical protein
LAHTLASPCFGCEALTLDEFLSSDVPESTHMGEQRNQHQNPKLTIIALQNFPKVLEHFENPNLIIVEDVHAFFFFFFDIDGKWQNI